MSWANFIGAGVGVWARKAAAGLGLGVITYVGFEALRGQIDSAVSSMFSGLAADAYQIIALAGFVDAVGIWLGALSAAVGIMAAGKIGLLGGGS